MVLSEAPFPIHAAPALPALAVIAGALLVVLWLGPRVARGDGWVGFVGAMLPIAALGVAVAALFPPGSYLFAVPTVFAGVVALIGVATRATRTASVVLGAMVVVATATLWFWLALGLTDALEAAALPIVGLSLGLVAAPTLPWLSPALGPRLRNAVAVAALALAAAALLYPAYDADSPQRLSLVHVAVEGHEPALWVDTTWGPPPPELAALASFGPSASGPLGVMGMQRAAPTRGRELALAVPNVSITSDPKWTDRVALRIESARGADGVGVLVAPDVDVFIGMRRIDTLLVEGPPALAGMRLAWMRGVADAGVEVILVGPLSSRTRLYAFDVTRGLADAYPELILARDRRGVASQEGDLSISVRAVSLPGP